MLFVVSCTSTQQLQETNPMDEVISKAHLQITPWDCETASINSPSDLNEYFLDECYLAKAVVLKDQTFCEKVSNIRKEGCISKTLNGCEKGESDDCYFQLMHARTYFQQFFDKNEESKKYFTEPCEKMNESKDECLRQVAVILVDPSLCEKTQPDVQLICYSSVLTNGYANFDICEKMLTTQNDPDGLNGYSCWINVVLNKIGCVSSTFPPEYISHKISCPNDKTEKLNSIEKEAIGKEDELLCVSINDSLAKDGCFTLVAVKKEKPEICTNVKPGMERRDCLSFVALAKKDPTICEQQANADDKDVCYYFYGTSNLDADACRKSSGEGCVMEIVQKTKDITICEKAKDPDFCYNSLIFQLEIKNPEVCNRIKDKATREACTRNLAASIR